METAEKNLQENLTSLRLLKKKVHKCSKAFDVFIHAQAKMAKVLGDLSHAYAGTDMYKIFQNCESYSAFLSSDVANSFLETNKNIERAMELILTDTACKLATVKRNLANSNMSVASSNNPPTATNINNNSSHSSSNSITAAKLQNFSSNLYGTLTRKYTNNIDPRLKKNLKVVTNFEPNSSKINLNEIQPADASLLSAFDVNKMVVQTKFDLPSMVLTYLKNIQGFFFELNKNFGRDPEDLRKFQLELQTLLTKEKDQLNDESRRLIEQLNLPLSSDTASPILNDPIMLNFAENNTNPLAVNIGGKDNNPNLVNLNLLTNSSTEKSDQMEGYLLWLKSKKNLISQRVYCVFNYTNAQIHIYSEDPNTKVSKNNVGLFNKIFSTNSKLLESFKVRRIERLENVTPQHVKSIKLTTDNQKKTYIFDGGKLTNIDTWYDAINSRVAQMGRLSVMNANSGTNISVSSKRKLTAAAATSNCKSEEMSPEMIFNFVSSCCDIIEKNFYEETGIYRISPTKNELDTLYDAFSNGQFLTDSTSSAYAGMVKKLVRDSTFLINKECYELWKDATTRNEVATFIEGAEKLPEISNKILQRLFQHLKEIAKFSSKNMMDYSNLAIVFAPTIFFNVDSEALMNLSVQKAIVVELMVNVNKVFNPVLGIAETDDEEKYCTIKRSGPGFSTRNKVRPLNMSSKSTNKSNNTLSMSDELILGPNKSIDNNEDDDAFEQSNESGLERTMPVDKSNNLIVKQKTMYASSISKASSDKSLQTLVSSDVKNKNKRGGASRYKRFERSKATKSVDNQQDAIDERGGSVDELTNKTDENDQAAIDKLPLSERLKFFEKISKSDEKKSGSASVGRQQTVNVNLASYSTSKFNKYKNAADKGSSKGTWL